MNDTSPPSRKSWPDYRAVWRWHFYAGLLTIPFVIILSITGTIYLFQPQIDAWQERPFDHLTLTGSPKPAAEQINAAVAAVPGSTFRSYELPAAENAATRVLVSQQGETVRVYVHPETLEVLHSVQEEDRFIRVVRQIHGELLIGDNGSHVVEIAACWTIILIVSGVYLWWPRNAKGLGGLLYPRLRRGSRIFWRDLHAVAGIWISGLAVFLIVTGLPWANFWGSYFKEVRSVTGTAVARQDWSTGSRAAAGGEHAGHGGHGSGAAHAGHQPPVDLLAVDRIVATVAPLNLAPPVLISPPKGDGHEWSVSSQTANRPLRADLTVDGQTGEITSRKSFADRHPIDQAVGVGIALHEGQMFGLPNQLLGVLTTGGLILLSVSGLILWWKRREQGVLGAPKTTAMPRLSIGLTALVLLFAALLPLFGASLVIVWLAERLLLRRIPAVRDWLGLNRPQPALGSPVS